MQIEIGTFEWVAVSIGALLLAAITASPVLSLYISLGAAVVGQMVGKAVLDWTMR